MFSCLPPSTQHLNSFHLRQVMSYFCLQSVEADLAAHSIHHVHAFGYKWRHLFTDRTNFSIHLVLYCILAGGRADAGTGLWNTLQLSNTKDSVQEKVLLTHEVEETIWQFGRKPKTFEQDQTSHVRESGGDKNVFHRAGRQQQSC